MDSKAVLYSAGRNDECMTPREAVTPLLKFIPAGARVWCPFDKEDSWFVKEIGRVAEVVRGHVDEGLDYFEYEPERWDLMVSNPPFTGKRRVFERALGFGKPFALLMSNTWLNDSAPKQIWTRAGRELQLLMFEKRIHFDGRGKVTFSSSYFCADFLPRQIVIEPGPGPNSGRRQGDEKSD